MNATNRIVGLYEEILQLAGDEKPTSTPRRVPSGVLRLGPTADLASDLGTVVRSLNGLENRARFAADSIQTFPDLADAIRDFANAWDDNREKMVKSITTVQDVMKQMDTAFTEVDRRLALSLTDRDAFDAEVMQDMVASGDAIGAVTYASRRAAEKAAAEQAAAGGETP